MAIEVRCPAGHRLAVEDRHAGKRLRCPKCQKIVAVPKLDQTEVSKPLSPPPLPPRTKPSATVEAASPASDLAAVQTSAEGYQADRYHTHTVYAIAVGLALVALFQLAPPIKRGEFAPAWAQCAILLVAVQLIYALWLALAPDWSTLWVAMLAFAGVAALYGAALAIAVITPRDKAMLLGMDDVRDSARLWCSAVILVTTMMTYVCGRASYTWYKSYRRAR